MTIGSGRGVVRQSVIKAVPVWLTYIHFIVVFSCVRERFPHRCLCVRRTKPLIITKPVYSLLHHSRATAKLDLLEETLRAWFMPPLAIVCVCARMVEVTAINMLSWAGPSLKYMLHYLTMFLILPTPDTVSRVSVWDSCISCIFL